MSIYLQSLLSVEAFSSSDNNYEQRTITSDKEEIELILSGKAILLQNNQEVEVGPNHILWFKSGEKTLSRILSEDTFKSLIVSFQVSSQRKRPAAPISLWQSKIEASTFSEDLLDAWENKTMKNLEALRDYCYYTLLWNAKLGQTQPEYDQQHFAITLSYQFINENFSNDISIEDIAKYAKVSSSHLFSLFKKHLQKSPHQVLLDRRLSEAKERLKYTDNLIKDISTACGFSNVIVFCRSFRKACGMTPTEYRFSFRSHY